MDRCNSIETTDRKNLTEQAKFRLDEINKIEIIFIKKLIKENHAVKN